MSAIDREYYRKLSVHPDDPAYEEPDPDGYEAYCSQREDEAVERMYEMM